MNRVIPYFLIVITVFSIFNLPVTRSYTFDNFPDLREGSFVNQGYDLTYSIEEGSEIDTLFSDFGFNISGLLSSSEFHVLVKDRYYAVRNVFFIESNKTIPMNVSVFSIASYLSLHNKVVLSMNSSSALSLIRMGRYNLNSPNTTIIESSLPDGSAISTPKIFSDITRPDFYSLFDGDILGFLPLVLGTDFDRYEAEFTIFSAYSNFNVQIYNEQYTNFRVSLYSPSNLISIQASWDKQTGLLCQLFIQIKIHGKLDVFSIKFQNYSIIRSPIKDNELIYKVTNSYASAHILKADLFTKYSIDSLCDFINGINNTEALIYNFYKVSGLNFMWKLSSKDPYSGKIVSPSVLHDTFVKFIHPMILPVWNKNDGEARLIGSISPNILPKLNGLVFFLSNNTLYKVLESNIILQQHINNSIHYYVTDSLLRFKRIQYQPLLNRTLTQYWDISIKSWLAYNSFGQLIGFSLKVHQYYNYFFNPEISSRELKYHLNYLIESVPDNITIPSIISIETSPASAYSIISVGLPVLLISTLILSRKKKIKIKR